WTELVHRGAAQLRREPAAVSRRPGSARCMDRGRAVRTLHLSRAVRFGLAAALRSAGVTVGDRVAGFMPNVPETVIAMLAAASIGAIWSSCSPDFGVDGVL